MYIYNYMGMFKEYNYEVVMVKNGETRRSFEVLSEADVKKVVEDYIAEGAKEVTNHDHIITAIF